MGRSPSRVRRLGGQGKESCLLKLKRMPLLASVNAETGKGELTKCGARYAELENNASVVREVVKNPCPLSAKSRMGPSVRIVMALVYVRAIKASES